MVRGEAEQWVKIEVRVLVIKMMEDAKGEKNTLSYRVVILHMDPLPSQTCIFSVHILSICGLVLQVYACLYTNVHWPHSVFINSPCNDLNGSFCPAHRQLRAIVPETVRTCVYPSFTSNLEVSP